MALRPHDLLRIPGAGALSEFDSLPAWACDSLRACPFVVVRRARAPDGFVAVGIRGVERGQRATALLPLWAVEDCISPEDIAQQEAWLDSGLKPTPRWALPPMQALRHVAMAAEREGLGWGPIGSVGFELTTGRHVVSTESDLDILVRFSSRTGTMALRRFRAALKDTPARVDIVLEANGRAAVLDEYLESPRRVLIKTPEGPYLGAFAG